jgi:hypothetical protein
MYKSAEIRVRESEKADCYTRHLVLAYYSVINVPCLGRLSRSNVVISCLKEAFTCGMNDSYSSSLKGVQRVQKGGDWKREL